MTSLHNCVPERRLATVQGCPVLSGNGKYGLLLDWPENIMDTLRN
jgi:hypothetical protein